MANIKDEEGVNDCKYNCEGKCKSPNIIANKGRKISESGFVWSAKSNCVFSQMGTQLCGAYEKQKLF
jgi:hypothetical protein